MPSQVPNELVAAQSDIVRRAIRQLFERFCEARRSATAQRGVRGKQEGVVRRRKEK